MKNKKVIVKNWITINCLKSSEGGMSKSYAMQLLKESGIRCRSGYSPLIGHYGIEVDERQYKKTKKIL